MTAVYTGTGTRQFCTFMVADLFFGVDVLDVQEVILHDDCTPVPLAPAEVSGLINLRGHIVTAIDLRRRLGMPPAGQLKTPNGKPLNIVARVGNGAVSLLVDEIGDVLYLPDDAFEEPPPTLRGPAREIIRGVYKLDKRLMLELDTERAITLGADGT